MSGGWEERQARTRRAVLDAARDLIAEHGVDEMSMRKLAERAGVAVGTLYNQFEDRKGVLVAIIVAGLDELDAELDAGPSSAPIDGVRQLIDGFDRRFEREPEIWRPVLAAIKAGPGPHGLGTTGERILATIEADLRAAADAGVLVAGVDVAAISRHLLLTWLHALERWANGTLDWPAYRSEARLGRELALAAVLVEPQRTDALRHSALVED